MMNKILFIYLILLIHLMFGMTLNNKNELNLFEFNDSIKTIRSIIGKKNQSKSMKIIYGQKRINDECFIEYNGQLFGEQSVIQIRKKYYRVENCSLERVFHACGPNLMFVLNIVCRVVEQNEQQKLMIKEKRNIYSLSSNLLIENNLERKSRRMITESCCENLCNVAEITRYCHTQ